MLFISFFYKVAERNIRKSGTFFSSFPLQHKIYGMKTKTHFLFLVIDLASSELSSIVIMFI